MKRTRNGRLIDAWSFVHLSAGVISVFIFPPLLAFALLALWEPFENLLISPLLWRLFKINFGHESFANAASDVAFDGLGIVVSLLFLQNV